VLRPRPDPYAAAYLLFRIDDRRSGRELVGRIAAVVPSAAHPRSPAAAADTWASVARGTPSVRRWLERSGYSHKSTRQTRQFFRDLRAHGVAIVAGQELFQFVDEGSNHCRLLSNPHSAPPLRGWRSRIRRRA
jgi:hypothetical protein